ncbi:hypothetical protein HZC31_07750 [Candidatus Woesearchaeota archaeon]|nr:hypothetical protein [Candidatus Woesearchaeota archaeon]
MTRVSTMSLTGILLTTPLATSGCFPNLLDESTCTTPLIYSLIASPAEAAITDSVIVSVSVYNNCSSVPVLTFPHYGVSSLPGYEVEPSEIQDVEGIVFERTDDENLVFATQPLPIEAVIGSSAVPLFIDYSVTVYGGFFTFDKQDTLGDYITILPN